MLLKELSLFIVRFTMNTVHLAEKIKNCINVIAGSLHGLHIKRLVLKD